MPEGIFGELYLSAMPGRYGSLDQDLAEIEAKAISRIACLSPIEEIKVKSPAYAKALRSRTFPWPVKFFPIADRSIPQDREQFAAFVSHLANEIRAGEAVLLHCGAGIGRAGTVAICVLMALGRSRGQAEMAVRRAGSYPERPEQHELIAWFAQRYRP